MIIGHVWRPPFATGSTQRKRANYGLCAFMNCRLPRGQHERAVENVKYRHAESRQS